MEKAPPQSLSLRYRLPLYGLAGLLGLMLILHFTPWGIGVSHDSVYYLDAAENVLAGDGLRWQAGGGELRPLTHYPPLYPLVLTGIGFLGLDLVEGARVLAALLFAMNLVLIAWLIYRHTHSWWATLTASLVALISPILIDVHLMALSEPLFMLLLLLTCAALAEYFRWGETRFLIATGIMAGLANLTRYAGLSLTATCFLAMLLFRGAEVRKKISATVVFLLLSLVPLLGWNLRNQFLAGTTVGRIFMYHPIPIEKLKLGARALLSWILPEEVPFQIGMGMFYGALVVSAAIIIRNLMSRDEQRSDSSLLQADDKGLMVLSILFVLVYGLFLVVSLIFVDASTPLDLRILSPAYLMTMVAIFSMLGNASVERGRSRLRRSLIIALGAFVFVSYVGRSAAILKTMREEGRGFTNRKWETSELIIKVREMDEEALIYTSDALRLYFLTDRPVYQIPQKINPVRSTPIDEYPSDLELMRDRLKEPGAALVLFSDSFELYRPELPTLEEISEGLSLFWNTRHGVIYIDPINEEK